MNHMLFKLIGLLIVVGQFLPFHLQAQTSVHQANQKIWQHVMQKQIEQMEGIKPEEKARLLRQHLVELAQEAIKNGFDLSIYRERKEGPYFVYHTQSVWEGQNQHIPLTILLYIWPAERRTRQFNNHYHASEIHDHPIPCALTVLQGTLNQESFILVPGRNRVVRKVGEEELKPGQMILDEGDQSFIHRLVCRDAKAPFAISVHAYGAASFKEVGEIFQNTYTQHVYTHVLNSDMP